MEDVDIEMDSVEGETDDTRRRAKKEKKKAKEEKRRARQERGDKRAERKGQKADSANYSDSQDPTPAPQSEASAARTPTNNRRLSPQTPEEIAALFKTPRGISEALSCTNLLPTSLS